ncbi:MAG: FAD-dependent monooxygenase [Acetobacteraceae bacterium]|nr:FAD-dependent monooxygenase [Acetobacteraceae bacterium]
MSVLETEVAIIGGGPVGQGLAIELARRGVESVVIERHPTPQRVPKGQNLTQRTMEHFRNWGIEDALRAARPIPPDYGIGGMTAYGTLLSRWTHDWLQRELVRPFYATDNERLPQYETERVLRARAAELPGITSLYGLTAETVSPEGRVTAVARDGSRREVRARYVVGCDGARSLLREQAGIALRRTDHDRLMVLLVFKSDGLRELLKRYPGKSFYCVLHPELDGYWRFFGRVDLEGTFFFHAPVPAGTTRDSMDFARLLHEAVGAGFDVVFDHIGFWDLRIAVAESYRAGRCFVAGDAAHSHPPYGGYGINTGFEDAVNLAWKLTAALRGWGGDALLDSYDSERRPVFESTARDFIERAIETDRDFLRRFDPARDEVGFAEAWAARTSGAKSEVGGYEPHYEGSPVVWGPDGGACSAVGAHRFAARPGHHLAPLALGDGRSAFDALGTGFTLVSFAPDAAEPFVAAARRRGVPMALLPASDPASRAAYGAGHILVRPDAFVAWAGDAVKEPEAVLARTVGQRAPVAA